MKRKKLVIISHTEHYDKDGEIVGWGPTINEINYLSDFWEEVLHVACLFKGEAPPSSVRYAKSNIRFIPLHPTGGKKLWNKLDIIWHLPSTLSKIYRSVGGATEVQFRAPTGMGVYLLPAFSFLFKRRFNFWVKYAGNWAQEKPPLGYQIQRWWLKKNLARCKVTINGFWPDQPAHCHSFENPCLTEAEISRGKIIQARKHFKPPFRLAFVGRLEDEKGVSRIIESLKGVDLSLIEQIDFIGNGPKKENYRQQSSFMGEKARFNGFMNPVEVHDCLSKADFFLLPSESEGFPKVIAEAACYGCVPIVSNVGSIGHYVDNESNGFVWENEGEDSFTRLLKSALSAPARELALKSKNILLLAEMFTFENYKRKLEEYIFK